LALGLSGAEGEGRTGHGADRSSEPVYPDQLRMRIRLCTLS
jgi:hypothetical protein